MVVAGSATPLIGLDALVLDTETTDLDPRKASIVEIALVPLTGGRLDAAAHLRSLVRPAKPIPREATRIHGINDTAVADAPTFAQIWPVLSSQIGGRVMVGHSIGYDLAVLQRECARAGIAWQAPRALDVRLLAEAAVPNLPDYALDSLAAWLGVETGARHSALGDAVTAGGIFLGLVPRLREHGIRTLAEAERACAALIAARDAHRRAGWTEPGLQTDAKDAGALLKIDSYPYRHRVSDVMTAPAKFVAADAPLGDVLKRMAEARVSSFFVALGSEASTPDNTGIVTERDAMRCVAARGADALSIPVSEIASRPLATVPADGLVFVAMARMNRLKVRHLGVVDETMKIVGALSARDLLRLRAEESVSLGDEIAVAADVHELGLAWARLPEVAAGLLSEGLLGREIAAVVSHQLAALTERATVLAEQRLRTEGRGAPPCPYVFTVLGSAGRGESLLAMDQDNALIFADGGDTDAHDLWFAALANNIADILHEVGVPYCKGGVMARNPQWRGSVSAWRQRIETWVRRSKPQDLLAVDIFFDMRGVYGDLALAQGVWHEAFDAAKGQAAFAKLLAASAGEMQPGLTLLGGFRTDKGRIDVKKSGLFGLVTVARALAICHHVVERSTPARLTGLKALGRSEEDLDALAAAQQVFLDLIVAQQLHDIGRGVPPSNAVEIKRLSRQDRTRLRGALKAVRHLDELTRDLLFDT
jgi:DNA polymerase-3 subunit epsilon/CBS domain-containing protein